MEYEKSIIPLDNAKIIIHRMNNGDWIIGLKKTGSIGMYKTERIYFDGSHETFPRSPVIADIADSAEYRSAIKEIKLAAAVNSVLVA